MNSFFILISYPNNARGRAKWLTAERLRRLRSGAVQEAVIVSAVRPPTGKFLGALKDLGDRARRPRRARGGRPRGIDPASVEECIMGNVVSAGLGRRRRGRRHCAAGSPITSRALTINKVCGSGLKAVMLAAAGNATGDIEIAVAGGMESMSNTRYLLPGAREG